MLKLYIGNKNYSSWSMRPWVLLKQAGIVFEEVRVRFDSFDAQSEFKRTIGAVSPTAKVPVLVDGDLVVWDTLAIAEYVAETHPDKKLWPTDTKARARARSVCAEMHSGFTALRSHCPMNIEAQLADTGALIWRDQAGVRADVQRWRAALLATAPECPQCYRLATWERLGEEDTDDEETVLDIACDAHRASEGRWFERANVAELRELNALADSSAERLTQIGKEEIDKVLGAIMAPKGGAL